MIIYIDLLIILNFIYDFLLLMTVSITLKRNISIKRIILGSIFGSLIIFILFLRLNKYILLIIKIITGIIILIITFSYKNIKYLIENIIYFYMCSIILSGFLYFLKIEFNNMSYLISLLIAPLILFLYIKEQNRYKKVINHYRNVIINFKNGKSITLTGFIDSGNHLKDPITNKYIIIINKRVLKGIYSIRSPVYVCINTINGSSILPCVSIKSIVVNNKEYNNYLLGIVNNLKDIDCLLNYKLMEDIYV